MDTHRFLGELAMDLGHLDTREGPRLGRTPREGGGPAGSPSLLGSMAGGMRLWWRFSSLIWESAEVEIGLAYH